MEWRGEGVGGEKERRSERRKREGRVRQRGDRQDRASTGG